MYGVEIKNNRDQSVILGSEMGYTFYKKVTWNVSFSGNFGQQKQLDLGIPASWDAMIFTRQNTFRVSDSELSGIFSVTKGGRTYLISNYTNLYGGGFSVSYNIYIFLPSKNVGRGDWGVVIYNDNNEQAFVSSRAPMLISDVFTVNLSAPTAKPLNYRGAVSSNILAFWPSMDYIFITTVIARDDSRQVMDTSLGIYDTNVPDWGAPTNPGLTSLIINSEYYDKMKPKSLYYNMDDDKIFELKQHYMSRSCSERYLTLEELNNGEEGVYDESYNLTIEE